MKQEKIILVTILLYYIVEFIIVYLPNDLVLGYIQPENNSKDVLDYLWLACLTIFPYLIIKIKSFNVKDLNSFKYGYYLSLGLMIGFSYSSGLAVPYVLLASSCRGGR
jgi:hypothetical protein